MVFQDGVAHRWPGRSPAHRVPPSRQEVDGTALPRVLGLWCPLQSEAADSLFFLLGLPEAGSPPRSSPCPFYAGPRQAVGLVLGEETCAGLVPDLSFSVILPKMGCCFGVREQLWGHPQPWPSLSTRGAGPLHGGSSFRSQQASPTDPQSLIRVSQQPPDGGSVTIFPFQGGNRGRGRGVT